MHYSKRAADANSAGNTIANAVHGMLQPVDQCAPTDAPPAPPRALACSAMPQQARTVDVSSPSNESHTRSSSPWKSLKRWAGTRSRAQQLGWKTVRAVDRAATLKAQGQLAAGTYADSAAQVQAGARFGLRWEEEVGVAGSETEEDAARDDRWMLLPHEAALALRKRQDLSWAEAHRREANQALCQVHKV